MSEEKKTTIEELAVMVAKGFEGAAKDMKEGFREVNERLDRIENLILADHRSRQVKDLQSDYRNLLGMKK